MVLNCILRLIPLKVKGNPTYNCYLPKKFLLPEEKQNKLKSFLPKDVSSADY